jgi:hypothetical protein
MADVFELHRNPATARRLAVKALREFAASLPRYSAQQEATREPQELPANVIRLPQDEATARRRAAQALREFCAQERRRMESRKK